MDDMPLSNLARFEGVAIQSTSTDGLLFEFRRGKLHLTCNNFSGKIVLSAGDVTDEEMQSPPTPAVQGQSFVTGGSPALAKYEARTKEMLTPAKATASTDALALKKKRPLEEEKSDARKRERVSKAFVAPTIPQLKELPNGDVEGHWVQFKSGEAGSDSAGVIGGPWPQARWGLQALRLDERTIMLYGGHSEDKIHGDCHLFNLGAMQWQPSGSAGASPLPRVWHSCTMVPEGPMVLAFGGQGEDPEDPKEPGNPLDTLMVLDPDIMLWYPPGVSGDKPTPRAGASLTYLNNKVVLFGGVKRRKFVNEVYSLDPLTWRWERPVIRGKAPLGRCYHSATAVGDKLVIIGGNDSENSFNSVHVLDTSSSPWAWVNPCVVGNAPSPRTGHSATLINDRYIVVIGGWDPMGSDTIVNEDAFVLDTQAWEWHSIALKDVPKGTTTGRSGHAALAAAVPGLGQGVLVMCGVEGDGDRTNSLQFLCLPPSITGSAAASAPGSSPMKAEGFSVGSGSGKVLSFDSSPAHGDSQSESAMVHEFLSNIPPNTEISPTQDTE